MPVYARAVSDSSDLSPRDRRPPAGPAAHPDEGPSPRERSPKPPGKRPRDHGYRVTLDGEEPLRCGEIRGFYEATRALVDRRAPMPELLVLLALEGERWPALERWAEDSAQVRRALVLRRCTDGLEIKAIATLSAYGRGVVPALALESVTPCPVRALASLTRSGVHRKVEIEALLAAAEASPEALPSCFGACWDEKG